MAVWSCWLLHGGTVHFSKDGELLTVPCFCGGEVDSPFWSVLVWWLMIFCIPFCSFWSRIINDFIWLMYSPWGSFQTENYYFWQFGQVLSDSVWHFDIFVSLRSLMWDYPCLSPLFVTGVCYWVNDPGPLWQLKATASIYFNPCIFGQDSRGEGVTL